VKFSATELPLFFIFAETKTFSPATGNLGSKEISATERSNDFGVILLILPVYSFQYH
jgi:hypothetical protein